MYLCEYWELPDAHHQYQEEGGRQEEGEEEDFWAYIWKSVGTFICEYIMTYIGIYSYNLNNMN